jgi:UDPglucose 6-dehydrogenase
MMEKNRLGIVGSGNVGTALGKALIHYGEKVVFNDINPRTITNMVDQGYEATDNLNDLLDCNVLFICVPTPNRRDNRCNTDIIEDVVKSLKDYNGIIVQVSTCPPGTGRRLSKLSGAEYVVYPSFYSMARMEYDAVHPIKVMLGTADGSANMTLTNIMAKFNAPLVYGTYELVELSKYADNNLSALMISYWNEIHAVAEKLDVDSDMVARMTDLTPLYRSCYRYHGKAFGGDCLPKDTLAFLNWSVDNLKYHPKIVDALIQVNEEIKQKDGVNLKHIEYRL